MFISFTNVPKRFDQEKIKRLSQDVLSSYFSRQKLYHLDIEIIGKRNLIVKEGVWAYCNQVDYRKKPIDFEIEIDVSLDPDKFYQTLIHEFVHVKQYMKGELKDSEGPTYKQIWKGEEVPEMSYSRQPWERQALYLEKKLAKKFLNTEPCN